VAEATAWLRAVDTSSGAWVSVRQHGVRQLLDASRVMFSSGNVSEKARMAAQPAGGETVVDLFAGIGYFTLPLLLRARARFVHACDWNPHAVACLRMNLVANGVDPSRYRVWPGDNRQLLSQPGVLGSADRVMLGLIPTSEPFWSLAVAVLKPSGGVLHVHENKADAQIEGWLAYLTHALEAAAAACGRPGMRASVVHLERVKSYAPHVWHVVADVRMTAAPGEARAPGA
jgi:tRNA G37 N-methylase Trm5